MTPRAIFYAFGFLCMALFFAAAFLPPCAAEDAAWCYWDSHGSGRNFISLWPADPAPFTIYLP